VIYKHEQLPKPRYNELLLIYRWDVWCLPGSVLRIESVPKTFKLFDLTPCPWDWTMFISSCSVNITKKYFHTLIHQMPVLVYIAICIWNGWPVFRSTIESTIDVTPSPYCIKKPSEEWNYYWSFNFHNWDLHKTSPDARFSHLSCPNLAYMIMYSL